MKLLLLQNLLYIPSLGGANKLTRLLMEALACRGHKCGVVAPAIARFGPRTLAEYAEELNSRGIQNLADSSNHFRFHYHGVEALTVPPRLLREFSIQKIHDFQPDVLIVTGEDPGQMLLEIALGLSPDNIVYLVQTPWNLPFGELSIGRSQAKTQLIAQAKRIVTISHFMKEHMLKTGNLNSIVIRFPVFGAGPFADHRSFATGLVTIVNPSKIKGITLFIELAKRLSQVQFGAVPTWATTPDDVQLLRDLPNVTLLKPTEHIDLIFSKTSILLVPSLWDEAFGFVVVEAMLRGIPVLASKIGGLTEAKLGVDYSLPIRPIEAYRACFDYCGNPVAIVPEQNIEVWEAPLRRLLTDREHYENLSYLSRAAASAFVSEIDVTDFEKLLAEVFRESHTVTKFHLRSCDKETSKGSELQISPQKRALLAQRALKMRGRSQ